MLIKSGEIEEMMDRTNSELTDFEWNRGNRVESLIIPVMENGGKKNVDDGEISDQSRENQQALHEMDEKLDDTISRNASKQQTNRIELMSRWNRACQIVKNNPKKPIWMENTRISSSSILTIRKYRCANTEFEILIEMAGNVVRWN